MGEVTWSIPVKPVVDVFGRKWAVPELDEWGNMVPREEDNALPLQAQRAKLRQGTTLDIYEVVFRAAGQQSKLSGDVVKITTLLAKLIFEKQHGTGGVTLTQDDVYYLFGKPESRLGAKDSDVGLVNRQVTDPTDADKKVKVDLLEFCFGLNSVAFRRYIDPMTAQPEAVS